MHTAPPMDTARRPTSRSRGVWAEELALGYLLKNGLKVIDRNYRCKLGEIDLVMRQGDTTVFVEVRYRGRRDFGSGAESIDGRKRKKLVATARHYLQRHVLARNNPCRFDVLSISPGNPEGQDPGADGIQWIQNAFEA